MKWRQLKARWLIDILKARNLPEMSQLPNAFHYNKNDLVLCKGEYFICEEVEND